MWWKFCAPYFGRAEMACDIMNIPTNGFLHFDTLQSKLNSHHEQNRMLDWADYSQYGKALDYALQELYP